MSGALQRATFWNLPAGELAAHFQERRMEGATAVVPFVRPAGARNAVARYSPRPRRAYRGFDDFMPALATARAAAITEHGEKWWANPNASLWARVPAAWVAWKGFSRSGSSPRDMHFPIGKFWPGGVLPIGPDYAAPVSVVQFDSPPPHRRLTIEAPAWEWLDDAAD
jgi:hypothetical protein